MKFSLSSLLALTLISGSVAIKIPAGLSKGLYIAALDATNGDKAWTSVEIPARLACSEPPSHVGGGSARAVKARSPISHGAALPERGITSSPEGLTKRGSSGCIGHELDSSVYYDVYSSLSNYCSLNRVVAGNSVVIQANDDGAVSYICNYNDSQSCNSGDIVIFYDTVQYWCGATGTGYDHLSSDNFTYGIDVVDASIRDNI